MKRTHTLVNIGNNFNIPAKSILLLAPPYDTTSIKNLVSRARQNEIFQDATKGATAKTVVVTDKYVYHSPLTINTIKKRIEESRNPAKTLRYGTGK